MSGKLARKTILAAAGLLLITGFASAETCEEKFIRLLVDGNGDGAVKIQVTQEIKGGMTSETEMLQAEQGHWLTKTISPANQPWILIYNDVMYTSADEGTTWSKLREMNSMHNAETARENRLADAQTTHDAVCGEEELDGVMIDTVEATYEVVQNFKSTNRNKYWLNRNTGMIVQVTYDLKADNFESFTTQKLEPAPGLELPKPE